MFQRTLVAVSLSVCCAVGFGQEKEITNSIGMRLVLIPKGTFTMGSPVDEEGSSDDERQHEVTISKDFYLGAFEVTQAQYLKIMKSNPSYFQGKSVEQRIPAKKHPITGRTIEEAKIIPADSSNHPIEQVSLLNAARFCKLLSELREEKKAGRVYRCPTEAEWEYACRAGSKTKYSFGDDESKLGEFAWFFLNSDSQTHPVGKKKPNAWGLYDMHGNVWEWCSDSYGDYPKEKVTDPDYTSFSSGRVNRGGSYRNNAERCRAAGRDQYPASSAISSLGFRVALSVPELSK
jgi:formylglycine-generating enzyme required for sulfatase activity